MSDNLRVVKTYKPDSDGYKEVMQPLVVHFEGTREECYEYMLSRATLNRIELMYPDGTLSSYIL